MSGNKNKTCQFKSKSKYHSEYKCPEPALRNSENGYCIFHESRKDKNIEKFNEGLNRKFDKKDYEFRGYWFPKGIPLAEGFVFRKLANFSESTFYLPANFGRSVFREDAIFVDCTFRSQPNFGGCTFEGLALFMGCAFRVGAYFDRCTFKQLAAFDGSVFKGDAYYHWVTFEGQAIFDRWIFRKWSSFGRSAFKDTLSVYGTKFEDPQNADEFFRKAKMSWRREGDYLREGECHYQEMDYIRKQKRWDIRYIWANLFHRLLHGYGEKPHRVILWATAIITGCALLFMSFGIGETHLFGVEGIRTYNISKILFKLYNLSLIDLANIGRYFYFSVVTFTTLGYGDLRPVHPISHLISSIEAFVGMFMMALFVLTFGRKWRR